MHTALVFIIAIVAYLAMTVIVLMIHEIGHVLAAWTLKLKVYKVGLTWKGAYTMREAGPPRLNIIASVAGPTINIVIGLLFLYIFPLFAWMNLILGITNLLPLNGSDGDRILKCWAIIKKEN